MRKISLFKTFIFFFIFKIYSTEKEYKDIITIKNVILRTDNKVTNEFETKIEIANNFDITNLHNYKIKDLIDKIKNNNLIKTNSIDIDSYYLFAIKQIDNNSPVKYDIHSEKVVLEKAEEYNFIFEKKIKSNIKIKFYEEGKAKEEFVEKSKDNVLLIHYINYQYLKKIIINNFKLKIDIDYFIKYIEINNQKITDYNFKITGEDITIYLGKIFKSDIILNLNSYSLKIDNLDIPENFLISNDFILLLINNNINNIKNYEAKDYPDIKAFSENINKFFLYDIVIDNDNSEEDEVKNINFNNIRNYLNTGTKHKLTIIIKDYIKLNVEIENKDLIFKKNLINKITNEKIWKCKKIKDLKKAIGNILNVKYNSKEIEIYKRDNKKYYDDNDNLVFNETYTVNFSGRFKKIDRENKNSQEKDDKSNIKRKYYKYKNNR